jgi:hypothetical protein
MRFWRELEPRGSFCDVTGMDGKDVEQLKTSTSLDFSGYYLGEQVDKGGFREAVESRKCARSCDDEPGGE